jgi:hypothetical protein
MPPATIQELRNLGDEFPLFSLAPFLASTKRRSAHEQYRVIARALADFLQCNNLTTRLICSADSDVPDDFVVCVGDLTDDGLRLYRDGEQKWLRAIDRGTAPTDTSILTKTLAKIVTD